MMAVEAPFRVTDLKQWAYCPRVLYYHTCLPDVRPVTYKMEAGIEAGKQEVAREVRRQLRRFGLAEGERAFNVEVVSERLGLRGTVDMIIWVEDKQEAEIVPVDYKLSRKAGEHFKLQLAAYALMLEEMDGGKVKQGYLYFIPLRRAEKVQINKRLREKLLKALDAMHRMLWTESMPPATKNRGKCVSCEFRRFCNDVL